MSVDTLIRAALDAGVALRFVDGKLRAVGRTAALRTWAPRLRQHRAELTAYLADAEEWKAERAGILEHDAGLSREEADAEAARLHAAWLVRDRAYQEHHWKCPTCVAASQGRGLRCGAGTALWGNYEGDPA